MKELFFWKVWSPSERRTTIAVLAAIILAIVLFLIKIIDPLGNAVRWNVLSEVSEINAAIDVLQIGTWQFSIHTPSQLVTESFMASVMETDLLSVRLFWIFTMAGISLILAALTTLSRFWYLAGMILLILFLAFCRLEILHVFGDQTKSFFLLTVILYGGISYYFHAFRTDLGISTRILSILGISAIVAALVTFGSSAAMPAFAAANYSYPVWMMLTALFLLISSTEIIAAWVWLSTAGAQRKGKGGLVNFIVISVLYLLVLLLVFLKNTRKIDWDVTLVSPVVLALLSGILGIWGFRKRADSTGGTMPFRSAGFWLYTGLFLIALSFSAFAAAAANDPVLEVLEDVVVQGQLAMGILFLFYILVNFYQLFQQGLAVHKVLYKPLRFGLTQTRLFGFAGVVILFSVQRLLPVNQSIAGYFNGLGDLHAATGEYTLAEQYYKLALQQEFQNHKSNYALASLAMRQGDNNAAAYYFRQSLLKNPSAQAYAGLGNILMSEKLFFDAVHSLQEGVGRFPESGELLNNLGMLYARTNVADSAYFYLEKAENNTARSEVPATNLLAILAKSAGPELLDSLTSGEKSYEYLSWQANWLAARNLKQQFSKTAYKSEALPEDSLLNVSSFAYLVNYAGNQARQDSTPAALLRKLPAKNPMLGTDLLLASIYPEFYSGNKLKALETLASWAAEDDEKSALYKKVLGHWFLQLGLYAQSIEAFSGVEGAEGTIGVAIANALQGNREVAVVLLDKLQENAPDTAIEQLKNTLFSGAKPKLPTDSLLAAAVRAPSRATIENAVRANPFDPQVITSASEFYRKQKQTSRAYRLVVDALRFNEYAPEIWAQYALLSLEQGLLSQAKEGEEKVKQYATPAGYQQFATRYQSMRALIEKQRAAF
ncbi:tetratricopeptide repeat protein [Dyadobacter sandarakinus]|uniref:Tetratricopeptide repeat protein n=1 Tax=Dyadobacter sandarakinus TaxID=2747268 RepID=A0ABX7IAL5_9BACT|nr:hypothetical protein [Dyadobacter sandarakinus]QRR02858.1 hypothetical protein HWI92_19050 [Dyadobacter sandarakinus]